MVRRRYSGFILLFLAAFSPALAVENFVHNAYDGRHWDDADIPVTLYLDNAFSTDWHQPLAQGAFNWSQAPRTNFRFRVPAALSGASVTFGNPDGYNVVSPILPDDSNYDSSMAGALAITWSGYADPNTHHFYEADIIFNTHDHTFYTGSDTPAAGQYDAEEIMTHEAGHLLLILDVYESWFTDAHKPWMGDGNTAWTMYGVAQEQETQKRTLEPFDTQGAAYIYPVRDTLVSKVPVNLGDAPWTWTYTPTKNYWTAVAVRAYGGTDPDKDLALYDELDRPLASSIESTGLVDFVVADYNHCAVGHPAWVRMAYGPPEDSVVEMCHEERRLKTAEPVTIAVSDPSSLVDVWDVFLERGKSYRFTVSAVTGDLDMGAALFQSHGGVFLAGRSAAAVLADDSGAGGTETFDFKPSADDWYGFLVFNNGAAPGGPTGSFRVELQDQGAAAPTATPATPTLTPTASRTPIPTRTLTPNVGAVLGEALDNGTLLFSPGGNTHPFSQTDNTSCAGDAVRSGAIGRCESSFIRATVWGPGELSFQWRTSSEMGDDFFNLFLDGVKVGALSGETAWTPHSLDIPPGEHVVVWSYDKSCGNSVAGEDAAWLDCVSFSPSAATATWTPTPHSSLAEAVDNDQLAFTTGTAYPWAFETEDSFYGGDAAWIQSSGDYTRASMTSAVTGPGILSFYWQTSTEAGYDILWLEVDGVRLCGISGATQWQSRSVTFGAGTHEVRWTYEKDTNNQWGEDAVWVDHVVFTPFPSPGNKATETHTPTPTRTPTHTETPTLTRTPSGTFSATATPTATNTRTVTGTHTITGTPTASLTPTPTPYYKGDLQPYPNPVKSGNRVSAVYFLPGKVSWADLKLFTTADRLVRKREVYTGVGIHEVEMDLTGLANGLYYMVLETDVKRRCVPLVLIR